MKKKAKRYGIDPDSVYTELKKDQVPETTIDYSDAWWNK